MADWFEDPEQSFIRNAATQTQSEPFQPGASSIFQVVWVHLDSSARAELAGPRQEWRAALVKQCSLGLSQPPNSTRTRE